MTAFAAILGLVGLLHAYVAWHFWRGFGSRRHPMQVVAALEPLGWAVAGAYAIAPGAPVRIATLAAALFVGAGCAFTSWLANHNRKLKTKWDARAHELGGPR